MKFNNELLNSFVNSTCILCNQPLTVCTCLFEEVNKDIEYMEKYKKP